MATNQTKGRRISPRKIIFRAMFVLSLVFIMVSVSFSWFNNGKTATVTGITVRTDEANNLVVKNENGEWVKELVIPVPEGFAFQAVTGNGLVFFEPVMGIEEVGMTEQYGYYDYKVIDLKEIPEEKKSEYVLTCDFSVSIEWAHQLYLANMSAVRGSSSDPRDYTSTILRMAVLVKENENYRPQIIWIPDVIVLNLLDNGKVDTSPESLRTETSIPVINAAGEATSISVEEASGSCVVDGITYVWGDITEPCYVTDIVQGEECRIRVVIWVDGSDGDCQNSLLSGNVSVEMNLTAIKPSTETASETITVTDPEDGLE